MSANSVKGQEAAELASFNASKAEIIENFIHNGGVSESKSRFLFVYVSERSFTLDTLRLVSDELQKAYCKSYTLTIQFANDKEFLMKLARYEKNPVTVDFPDTDQGRKGAEAFYRLIIPDDKGILLAEYSRYGSYEYLAYKLEKDATVMKAKTLRSPEIKGEVTPNSCSVDAKD
jgi:hypothetical protein